MFSALLYYEKTGNACYLQGRQNPKRSEANGKYAEGRVTHTAKVENGTILLDAEPQIAEYDGKAHDALISVTVDPKDCKLEYSLDGGEFTEIMPKVTMAAEEYTISIKASKQRYFQ